MFTVSSPRGRVIENVRRDFWDFSLANVTRLCGRSPAEIVGSNLTGCVDVCLL